MDGQKFRDLIDSRGMTARGVAERIGKTPNTLTNWAKGNTPIVPPHLVTLADTLGVTIDELAGRQPDRSSAEEEAIEVLGRLVDNAGALRAMAQAAPDLLGLLQDAELAVGPRAPQLLPPGPPSTPGT